MLQEYYITKKHKKYDLQGDMRVWTVQKVPMSYDKESQDPNVKGWKKKLWTIYWWNPFTLRYSDQL